MKSKGVFFFFFLHLTFTVHKEPFTMSLTTLSLGTCDHVELGPSEEFWGVIDVIYLFFFFRVNSIVCR